MPASLKILFVSSRFPYPPLQGDRVRAYHQLKRLGRRHRITLVTPVCDARDAQHLGEIEPLCERVITVPIRPWERARNLLAAPFSSRPWQTTYWYHSKIARAVHRACISQKFDLAHVQLVRMAPAELALNGTPRVLDFIDALSLNFQRRAEHQSGLAATVFRHEAKRLRNYENRLVGTYDRMLISSRTDRDFIGAHRRIHVVPNGVDLETFRYHDGARDPGLIIFSGRMGYFPNADGAEWFATEVLPILHRMRRHARLVIAGADPPASVRALAGIPGVEVTGYLPDLAACLRRASVAISPLRSGSGIQNKVLEAMASGTPAVVTPHSLGGLDAEHERHLLIATTATEFAAAIERLMGDEGLRQRIAREARALVESRYTWEHSVNEMEAVYRLAIEDRRGADA
jgi:sugar transferase (PEP-CTERM/EpsH1 system associated)